MGEELRYQERWGFRRNDGDLHSSSDDSNKPDSRKHNLVSSFISNENGETSDHTPKLPLQEIVEDHLAAAGPTKSKKREPRSNKKRKIVKKDMLSQVKLGQGESFGKVNRKKSKSKKSGEPPSASMDSLNTFVKSLVKDLQVASEELLVWMREEMHAMDSTTRKDTCNGHDTTRKDTCNGQSGLKLLADHRTRLSNVGSGSKGGKSNGKSLVQSLKSQKVNGSSNYPYHAENQEVELVHISDSDQLPSQTNVGPGYNKCNSGFLAQLLKSQKVADSSHPYRDSDQTHHQANVGSGLKLDSCNGGFVAHSSKPQNVADSNHQYRVAEKQVEPDHLASSMYFTVPSVMHESGGEPQRVSLSAYNLHAHPGISAANAELTNKPSQRGVHEPVLKLQKVSLSTYNAHPGLSAANTEAVTLTHKPPQGQYLMGIQKEQRGGQNVNYSDQTIPGFPSPLHQGLDRRFASPNQVGTENQHSNILGSKMDGGLLNLSQGNMDYFSRLVAYQNQNVKGGSLFPS